jgi:hypothetical protein
MEAAVFEHRTEAEMRLHSEKTARELALKRSRKENGDNDDTPENDDAIDPPPPADEAHGTTEMTVTQDSERAD